ncbi:MAG: serine--tRNA ligase [Solirubrobacterales bacterium]|nr:serine--tRNA ligase [Solirubrobacterales bacterium]HRV59616.1 serine--tRNA ligase [Solirubrobacterales bacterium]
MLDLKLIRSEPERVKAALARRGAAEQVDRILALDERRRQLLPEIEGARSQRKQESEKIGALKKAGEDATAQMEAVRQLKLDLEQMEGELESVESELGEVSATLPNLPDPTSPDGYTDEDAELVREVGEIPEFGFETRDHVELAGDSIELEAAAKVSGARFAYLKGDLVMLEFALVRWALETLRGEGHEPVVPPILVREEALFGTGFLPGDRDQIYELEKDELYLAGTSEVPLAGLHAGQILEADELPLRYAGFSSCFRREAGAAGRDTHGIFRVHQFDKVEMFSFVRPEDASAEHERILGIEEGILSALGLPYRVVNVAAGDLGGSAAKKYDCEAWIPSQERYRELTSCSNTTDFQARRIGCRYRPEPGAPTEFVNTLNGTAIAVGRTIIALLENHQQADGSVRVPEILVAYGAPATIGPT